jgi:hypothetical protein
VNLNQNYIFNNFLNYDFLNFFVQPNLDLHGLAEIYLGFGVNPNRRHNAKFKFDFKNNNLNIYYVYRQNSNGRITTNMTLGKKRYNLNLSWFRNEDNKHSTLSSLSLRNNNLTLNNSFTFHKKTFSLEFKSSLNFTYSKNFLYTTIFSVALKFSMFKLELPLIISKENSFLSNSLLFLSTLIGKVVMKVAKKWKKYKSNYLLVFNKVNRSKMEEFNASHQVEYLRRVDIEVENRGIVIMHAYFGEFNKIYDIYKTLLIFGRYNNDDPLIFDVKIPLTLNVVASRLSLPINLLDIQGFYNPDFYHTNELGLVIMYKHNSNLYTFITKNKDHAVELPEY